MKNFKSPTVKLYFFILLLVTAGVIWLFVNSATTINKMDREIINIEKIHAKNFAENIQQHIKNIFPKNLVNTVKDNPSLEKKINSILSLFSNEQYKYVYVIYSDKKGTLRYLADGSKEIAERGELNQKFEPVSPKSWKKVFICKKPILKIQKNISSLWITYLYPIKYNNSIKAILAFDISIGEYKNLMQMLQPMHNLLFILSILLIFILAFSFFQTFIFLRQRKKTNIDTLTHLFNRNYLEEIRKDINLSQCAIAMADIDHFKKINDNFGHDTGDIVLETVAKRLLGTTRTYDTVIRYGGEEFLIIFKKQTDINTLKEVSNRILTTISKQPIRTDEGDIYVTLSIGINPTPFKNKSFQEAIISADKMLYAAKTGGRNRVVILNKKIEENSTLILKDISKAIKDNRLKAYFQPILDIKTGKIVKYEALARIVDKNGNIYLPVQFLPMIKRTTVYATLTKFIIEEAFKIIKTHKISVSVNFFIEDILDNSIFDITKKLIKDNIKIADMLMIEILEDAHLDNISEFTRRMEILKSMNVKIAIDDFGGDDTNFNYLISIKPNVIKIDGSIISRLLIDENARMILKGIINICESLKIDSVAEFVESKEIFEMLKKYNIKMAQGYYIGKPLNIYSRKFIPRVLFFNATK